MNNLKSYTEYAVTSETTDFVIGFDFNYGTDAVNVTVDGVPATDAGYTVVYLNNTTMRLTPAVPTGVVRLQRETDIDVPDNSFTAGAKFIASNMDENFTQVRHAQQEVRDGFNKLSVDTNEIIDTLQVVGEAAQDAADAAEAAAQTANDAAAQVNDKVSYQDLDNAVDAAVTPVKDYIALPFNAGKSYALYERVQLENGDIVKSTVAGNTVDPNADMTGWEKTNDATQLIDDASLLPRNVFLHRNVITTPNKNGSLNWRLWDWEEAILSCIAYCTANNLTLTMPNGNVRYKGDLTFTCDVEAPQTRMIKVVSGVIQAQANFKVRAIRTSNGSILSGDTSRGLEIRSVTERCNVHVSEITGHGGDGAVLLKGNLSNIWVKSTRNGGRGFAIAADGAGDVRANTIYTETTRNCLNLTDVPQFEIEDYLTGGVPDNTKTAAYNRIVVITQNCESGPGYALRGRSQFVEVYSENNKSIGILDTSLDGSEITLLNHAIITVTNNSKSSNSISSLFSGGIRTKSLVRSRRYVLSDSSMNSQLAFEQTADRTFTIAASGSSNASTLTFDPALLKLRYGTTGLAYNNLQTGSLNFGSVAAGAVIERTKDVSSLTLPTYVTVSSTPNFAIPTGLVWSSYIQDGAIRVRVHNTTGSAIDCSGAWVHHIHGFSTNQ